MPAVATAAGLPSRLGKYELLLPLAAGGMAQIYIGRSTGIGSFERHVVLKMITPERANDVTAVNMFLDEARLAASLNHQNVAQVFEVGADGGIHYLAMEYVHGQDLRAVLAKAGSQGTRIPIELALTVVAGAAAGLNHAHERRGPDGVPLGIVHRDVSPSNIMIGYDGAVKLLDFGIAKATHRSVETQSGIIKGKFAYMAPEQCRGRDVDRRSDVFSLGIILYEITTQHRCFRADSDFDTMHRIVTGDVVRPTRLVQGYPQALEAIVMKALAIEASQRYQSAGLLLEALESFAIASRMSLSTMGLGRFMRDMFGEMQEPWLNTAATKILQGQALAAKENTISSTDGKGSHAHPRSGMPTDRLATANGEADEADEEDGRFQDSELDAAKTMLQVPGREQDIESAPSEAAWNAKSYPTPAPMAREVSQGGGAGQHGMAKHVNASGPQRSHGMHDNANGPQLPHGMHDNANGPQLPHGMHDNANGPQLPHGMHDNANGPQLPHGMHRNANGPQLPHGMHGNATGPHGMHGNATGPQQSHGAPLGVHGGAPPPGQFQHAPGSGSAPAHPSIASTKHGYASGAAVTRGDVSYPRVGTFDHVGSAEVQIRPNRRPLFIGIAIVTLGVIVMLAVLLGGSEKEPEVLPASNNEVTPTTKDPVVEQVVPPTGSGDAVDDNMVSIVIHSDPPGADVLIAGAKIGVTPFEQKVKRGTKIQTLTVRKDGYVDFAGRIDLGGEYENTNIKLVTVEEAKAGSGAPAGSGSGSGTSGSTTGTETSTGSSAAGTSGSTGTSGTTGGTRTGTGTSGTTGTKTGTGTTSTGTTGTKTGTGTTSTGTTGTKTGTGTTSTGTATGTKSGTGTTSTGTATGTKTGTGTTSTGTATGTKTGTGTTSTGTKTGTGTGAKAKPKCQPPGPNVDPFGLPVCKS